MTTVSSQSGAKNASGSVADKMAAARAGRKPGDANRPKLSQSASFQLQLVRNSAKACKLLAGSIQRGQLLDGDTIKACSILSGQVGSLLQG
jgi:hypothetical protein